MKIFILFIGVIILYLIYLLFRNNEVYNLVMRWNHLCYMRCEEHNAIGYELSYPREWTKEHQHYRDIWDNITNINYTAMLLSFKPLTDEAWLTAEQLYFINTELNVPSDVSESSESISTP